MTEGRAFFGGVPTAPDIIALRERWPDSSLTPGDLIRYSDVAAVLRIDPNSRRFWSVTRRWRMLVEQETGRVVLGCRHGVGFEVLDNTGKLDLSHAKLATAARAARRAAKVSATVDMATLSSEEKHRLLILQRRSAAIICANQIKGDGNLPSLGETK
ncbi:MAG: hypothetical protein AAGI34_14375 [Pseudomonadota bacterium]